MSLWKDIADSPNEAAALRLRSALMRTVRVQIASFGWSRTAAAVKLGVTQQRVSELMSGRLSQFSLDELVGMGTQVGVRVTISVDRAVDTTTQVEIHPRQLGAHE